jgi:hypothetical protein
MGIKKAELFLTLLFDNLNGLLLEFFPQAHRLDFAHRRHLCFSIIGEKYYMWICKQKGRAAADPA